MRNVTGLILLATLSACSGKESADPAADRPGAGPDVGVAARPGIAVTYDYRFDLPASRIAPAQERHAALCDRLGPDRCRITGMHYNAPAARPSSGSLDLALAPQLARGFGRVATAAITDAGGALVESSITSEDVGTPAAGARLDGATAASRLREMQQRLDDPRSSAEERSVIARETALLRDRIDAARNSSGAAAAKLSMTPMHIGYEAGTGNDPLAPVRSAFADALGNFIDALALLIALVAGLLPWIVAFLFALYLWRRLLSPALRHRSGQDIGEPE